MKEKIKKHKNKFIVFFISLFSFIPFSVHAIALTTISLIGAAGVLLTSAGFLMNGMVDGKPYVAEYDERLSLFDGLEANIPSCEEDYGIYCNKGNVPSIKKLIEDYPYLIRFKITDNSTNKYYYIFGFYETSDVIDSSCYGDASTCLPIIKSPEFTISMLPTYDKDSSFHKALETYPRVIGSFPPSSEYNYISYVPFSTSKTTDGVASFWRYFYSISNVNYSVELGANFEIDDEVNSTLVIGPTFETDMEITVKPGYYLRLFPKKTSAFSSYFITDNNFLYNYSTYDKDSNTILSSNQYGKLTQINFYALGKYPWFNWSFEFTDNDISSNKFLELYNSNENVDLHIKFFSKDFYYYLLDENSDCTSINDMCIPNNYNSLHLLNNSLGEVKNVYDNGDYDNGLSFIKEIPNMIVDFSKSFAFIGILFTTFFTIFTGSIANYFYIIFGLMIIMIIIKILK